MGNYIYYSPVADVREPCASCGQPSTHDCVGCERPSCEACSGYHCVSCEAAELCKACTTACPACSQRCKCTKCYGDPRKTCFLCWRDATVTPKKKRRRKRKGKK